MDGDLDKHMAKSVVTEIKNNISSFGGPPRVEEEEEEGEEEEEEEEEEPTFSAAEICS